jgi:ABC-type sugar transport system substrate-binding protein
MIDSKQGSKKSMRRRIGAFVVPVVAVGLLLSGCSSTPASSGSSSFLVGPTKVDIDTTKVQAIVDVAFASHVALSDLPEEAVQAYARAANELTDAQVETALSCWKQPECTIGDGPVHIGIFNAVDNLWQTTAAMGIILQAMTYPEIGKITYAAVTDLPSAQSAIRSMVAGGVNGILGYNAFGDALIPVFTEAQKAGAFVSTYVGKTPDMPVSAVSSQVFADNAATGVQMADIVLNDLKLTSSDQIAIFMGTPGNPQDVAFSTAATDMLAANNGPTVGFTADTDWSRAGTAKAATELIASGIPAKAILNSYTDPIPQAIAAYDQAGVQVPAIVSWTTSNELLGIWQERQGTPQAFALWYTNALVHEGRISLSNIMSLLAGEKVPAETIVPSVFIEAAAGQYQADLPGDFPGYSALVPAAVMTGMLK